MRAGNGRRSWRGMLMQWTSPFVTPRLVEPRWREWGNSGLRRLTGYQVTKADGRDTRANRTGPTPTHPAQAGPAQAGPGQAGPGQAGPGQAGAKHAGPRSNGRPGGDKYRLHHDFDDEAKQIISAVRERTMTSSEKLYALICAVRYVVRHDIPGDIVECGVWRGGSMQAVAMTLGSLGATDRHLHLFDTYEGMPPPEDVDRRWTGRAAAELMATTDRSSSVWAVADLPDVRQGMESVGYPLDHLHFVKGMVEDTVPEQAPERISLLRLDTDWYSSTRHELAHLYPRLSSGGVLILDDYGGWAGARKAVDEFLDRTGARLLLIRASGGRVTVKP